MGNNTSSSGRTNHEETVDFGHLTSQGVYTAPQDWNQPIVSQLICQRRLAPFYRPLEEYDDSWDDDQILSARKELPAPDADSGETNGHIETATSSNPSTKSSHIKRQGSSKEPSRPEAAVYRNAVECPICFLYYPPNINHSRCCDQAICTECFVQIKRTEPTATHLVSEPAACPYCVQDNFGVVYKPPPWRAGIGCETSSLWADPIRSSHQPGDLSSSYPAHKRRQKSYGADSPEVVTTDHIRPDWEGKLAAVRAAVARRANRRIVMRQVGDRLIPIGVTSGRVHPLSPEEVQAENVDNGTRRSRRRMQATQNPNFEQFMGMAGQDLEELMLMEAMRLSMIDHEEHQRREAEEKKKQAAVLAQSKAESASAPGASASEPSSRSTSQPSSSSPLPTPRSQLPDSLSVGEISSPCPSRSRTPPPPPPTTNSLPRDNDGSPSSLRHRTPPPAPFGVLTPVSAYPGDNTSPSNSGVVTNDEANSEIANPSQTPSMPSDNLKLSRRPGSPLPHGQISVDPPPQPAAPYDNLARSPDALIDNGSLLGSREGPPFNAD